MEIRRRFYVTALKASVISLTPTAKILRLPGRPGLPPELPAAVDRQRFASDKTSRGSGEVGGSLRNVPRRARAHHRVRTRVGRAGFRRIDLPAFGLDRAGRHAIYSYLQRRPFDGHSARQSDDAGSRGDGMRDAVETVRRDHHDIDDAAGVLLVAPALGGRLHHVPGAVQIGVDDRVPALDRKIDRGLRKLPAGAVDETVDTAVRGPHRVKQRVD